jgi:hypothetical protein
VRGGAHHPRGSVGCMALQRFHQQYEFLGKHGRGLIGEFWAPTNYGPRRGDPGAVCFTCRKMGVQNRQTKQSLEKGCLYLRCYPSGV